MIYPKKINANNGEIITKIMLVISIAVAIILTIINKLTTPNIPWAALANGGIVYIWVIVIYSIHRNVNIAGHVLVQTIAVSLLTVFIDYRLGFKGWSLSIAIPIILIVANTAMLILTIVSHKKYLRYAIYQLFILIFSVLPAILIGERVVTKPIMSIIAIGISILNLVITIILSAKDLGEAIKRKFHM